MDEAAKRLGIDPVELRVRNFADRDQDAGRPWSCNSLLEFYHVGAKRFGWWRRPKQGAAGGGRWRIGCGYSEHAVSREPASQQAARSLGIRWVVAGPARHAGHGLAHLFGARSDRGQRFGHSDVEGSRRAGRYMVAGRSLFQVALQVGASIFPAVDMATAKLRMTLTGMAVADKEPPLAGQRMEDLDFCEGVIRSRGRQCGSTIDRHTRTRSREQSGGRRLIGLWIFAFSCWPVVDRPSMT